MRTVSRFEASLLRVLRCFLGRGPLTQALPVLRGNEEPPPCLSRDCVELVEQSLARGIVELLTRAGGWHRERFLRGERIAEGRLWQRTRPEDLGLEFSANTVEFLMWLTAQDSRTPRWKLRQEATPTAGDQLLYFLAFRSVRNTEFAKTWCGQKMLQTNGLCALMFPDAFADHGLVPQPQFDAWLAGPGGTVLEALQGWLAERWIEVELSKARIVSATDMRMLGGVQQAVLDPFLAAADAARRRDLVRFLLVAVRDLLKKSPSAADWTTSLNLEGLRLSERMKTYGAALVFLRKVQRLADWQAQALNVGYLDEGYAASQLWKSDWERLGGEALCQSSRSIIRELEPLGGAAASESAAD